MKFDSVYINLKKPGVSTVLYFVSSPDDYFDTRSKFSMYYLGFKHMKSRPGLVWNGLFPNIDPFSELLYFPLQCRHASSSCGLVAQSNQIHRNTNCQFYHVLCIVSSHFILATTINLELRSLLALREFAPCMVCD